MWHYRLYYFFSPTNITHNPPHLFTTNRSVTYLPSRSSQPDEIHAGAVLIQPEVVLRASRCNPVLQQQPAGEVVQADLHRIHAAPLHHCVLSGGIGIEVDASLRLRQYRDSGGQRGVAYGIVGTQPVVGMVGQCQIPWLPGSLKLCC
jgi:hypothetical protein